MPLPHSNRAPLAGIKIIEMAGIGPAPFSAMQLADMGADVVRIDRAQTAAGGISLSPQLDITGRGKRSIALDLRESEGQATALALISKADGLIEGFRPGVMERFNLGPDTCLAANPALTYGRMTGWGQTGPYSTMAGHDINYLGLSGALHAVGDAATPPRPPLNLVADYAGGALMLTSAMLAGLLQAKLSGTGTVIDAAMTDGSASLMALFHSLSAMGLWNRERSTNFLDGSAPFYRCYTTKDGHYMAVGAIEPQFYSALLSLLNLEALAAYHQFDQSRWGEMAAAIAERFASHTQAHWCSVFDGTDACVTPVLAMHDAPTHPHNQARGSFYTWQKDNPHMPNVPHSSSGPASTPSTHADKSAPAHNSSPSFTAPAPAPRFSSYTPQHISPPPKIGADRESILKDWFDD